MRHALSGLMLAAVSATAAASITVKDDAGHTLTLAKPAQRIITLAPNLTEIAFAVGAGPQVVGVMRFSDYPAAALRLPEVGDAFALNLEAIAALKPDLILVWKSGMAERHKARLAELKLPVYESEIGSIDGLASTLQRVGQLTGHSGAAQQQSAQIRQRWQTLVQQHRAAKPVRVFYQLWHEPLMTVNRDHILSQAITACGGVNVFAHLPLLTPTIGWEAVAQANPQVILSGGSADERVKHASPPGQWAKLTQVDAVAHQRYAQLTGDWVSRMGPRFLNGVEQLCIELDAARPR